MKKYELTDETKVLGNRILHRIKALKDFGNVKVGDLGGFIEKEDNLSHNENCWVFDNACVFDNAKVYGYARVGGSAKVCNSTDIFVIGPTGSRNGYTTFYRTKDNDIYVTCDRFHGSIDEFIRWVNKEYGDSKHGQIYRKAAESAKLQLNFTEE